MSDVAGFKLTWYKTKVHAARVRQTTLGVSVLHPLTRADHTGTLASKESQLATLGSDDLALTSREHAGYFA